MNLDRATLARRSWAVPAISALFILHHDFRMPRLAEVFRLVWSDDAVDVHLRYGICNLSGTPIDTIEVAITLHRAGAVAIRVLGTPVDGAADSKENVLRFLTGEVAREAMRWEGDFQNWLNRDEVENAPAGIFALCCALAAYPLDDCPVEVGKPPSAPGSVAHLRLPLGKTVITLLPFGADGVTVKTANHQPKIPQLKVHHEHDMRSGWAPVKKSVGRYIRRAANGAGSLLLLPLDLLMYMADRHRLDHMSQSSDLVDYLPPPPLVDSSAGDGLSALSD